MLIQNNCFKIVFSSIFKFFAIILAYTWSHSSLYSQIDTNNTIIFQSDKRTDLEKLLGKEIIEPVVYDQVFLPGGDTLHQFTAEQDSAYYRAMRTKIPQFTRFSMELQTLSKENEYLETASNTSWAIALRNLAAIPAQAFAPDPVDITNHENSIRQSLYVPLVPTYMSSGLRVPLSTISQLLGLSENISPTIAYRLEAPTEVEVVVYSLQAIVVQTIFKGSQQSGNYSFTWNLRNDKGKKMPPGDYIIEARIGKYKIVRKRTII